MQWRLKEAAARRAAVNRALLTSDSLQELVRTIVADSGGSAISLEQEVSQ